MARPERSRRVLRSTAVSALASCGVALPFGLYLEALLGSSGAAAGSGLWVAALWLGFGLLCMPGRALWIAGEPGGEERRHAWSALGVWGLTGLGVASHTARASGSGVDALAAGVGILGLGLLAAGLELLLYRRRAQAWTGRVPDPLSLGRVSAGCVTAAALAPIGLAALVAAVDPGAGGRLGPWAWVAGVAAAALLPVALLSGLAIRDLARHSQALASRLGGAGTAVDSLITQQIEAIQSLTTAVNSVYGQVEGITGSAESLQLIVEESSSSIRELGAAGEELRGNAAGLFENVELVTASIGESLESVEQTSRSTELLAQALAETSVSTEEIATSMRSVSTDAHETGRLGERVVRVAESGREQVRQTIEGMEQIRGASETVERMIRQLGMRAREIGAIVNVIVDVANETNLLAVNAAIIASQAGEHGSAFGVVAEEIRDLAERVGDKTKEITDLIRTVQKESDDAIAAMERSGQSVASGVELSAAAGLSLEEITRAARESGEYTGRIVHAVEEQTAATAHVAELLEQVRAQSEQIRGASVSQQREGERVREQALAMRDVAEQVDRTSEEHSKGVFLLSQNIERVQQAFEQIQSALGEQAEGCSNAAAVVWQVHERTREAREATGQLAATVRELSPEVTTPSS